MRRLASSLLYVCGLSALAQAPTISAPDAAAMQGPTAVSVRVDLAKTEGKYKPIYSWFGYDELNFTTMKYGRQLLGELHDLTPAPVYIRAHHLFTSGKIGPEGPPLKWSATNVYTLDAAGKPVYDFAVIDQIFDTYKAAGVRPMVELGFMPEALATGTGPYYVAYPKTLDGSVQTPPKDYAAWGGLVRRFTAHMVERYGMAAVKTWYFEVWNEPDISYWKGSPEDYLKLYDYSVAAVRHEVPGAIVGGPAATGPGSGRAISFLDKFLTHCANDVNPVDGKKVPLDFISFHPKGSPKLIPASGTEAEHVRMGIAAELNSAANGFKEVAKFPQFKNTPIILSEADPEGCAACSQKDNPANGYRNGPLYPAYTAAAMKALFDLQDKYGVNLVGMVTWSFEFEGKHYFEGFRTLATNGVDKPVLNVFRMAGMLGGDRVAVTSSGAVGVDEMVKAGVRGSADVDGFATKADHEATVMVWNYHEDDLPRPSAHVTLSVTDIPAGVKSVMVEHYRIDETHSNAFTVWKAMGSPQEPTAEQYATLKAAGQLQMLGAPVKKGVVAGSLGMEFELPRAGTSLVRVKW